MSCPPAPTYSVAVQDALAATQDILGDLGLGFDMGVPASTGQGNVQEVELKMYDSDSLPSPPPSSESEEERDPLLDFSREDDLTYHAGQPGQPAQSLADSVRQATQALEVSGWHSSSACTRTACVAAAFMMWVLLSLRASRV